MSRSRRWYLILGCVMVGSLLFIALFADKLTAVSPYYAFAKRSLIDGTPPYPPQHNHPLGTDVLGRDVWSRIAYGTRWSLLFAFLIMAGRMLIAVPLGILAASGPRFFGWLTGRLYVFTSAIPPLLFYLLILTSPGLREIGLWPSITLTVLLLTLVEWPRLAVNLKGRMEELSAEQFIEGAIAAGATRWRIFWSHMMPHLWPTLLNMIVAEMGRGLLVIAQLGVFAIFMGGGIQESTMDARGRVIFYTTTGIPEWGMLLSDARTQIYSAPWVPIYSACAFFVGVVGFNFLAQGLEGVHFSFTTLREAVAERVSPWWQGVAVGVIATLMAVWILPVATLGRASVAVRGASAGTYFHFRGLYTDVEAVFDPLDPTQDATWQRFRVAFLATSADHAFESAAAGFPKRMRGRLQITLYPTQAAFDAAIPQRELDKHVTLYQDPGKRLHVAPAFIASLNRRDVETALTYELIGYLAHSLLGGTPAAGPVAMGAYELGAERAERYRIDFDKLAGGRFFSLVELFNTPAANLSQARLGLFAAQSALMIEFFERQGLPRGQIFSLVQGRRGGLAGLARALRATPDELDRQYQAELIQQIEAASVLHMPAGRARIPTVLTDMIEAEAAATPGMQAYVLEMDQRRDGNFLYVLEQRPQPDGTVIRLVSIQQWVGLSGVWTRVDPPS